MTNHFKILSILVSITFLSSCASKKDFIDLQAKYEKAQTYIVSHANDTQNYKERLNTMAIDFTEMSKKNQENNFSFMNKIDSISNILHDRNIILSSLSDRQSDFTVFSKEVSTNIDKSLSQLGQKD